MRGALLKCSALCDTRSVSPNFEVYGHLEGLRKEPSAAPVSSPGNQNQPRSPVPSRTCRSGGGKPKVDKHSAARPQNRYSRFLECLLHISPSGHNPCGRESPLGLPPARLKQEVTILRARCFGSPRSHQPGDMSESSVCHCPTIACMEWQRTRCATNDSLGKHASLVTVGYEAFLTM
jgi:hypothetical protein